MANDMYRESAIVWIKDNTTYNTEKQPYPSNVELFIQKYTELMRIRPGIASESISGLSHSYNTSEIESTLKQYAKQLIGEQYMKSDVKVIPALDRWTY